MTEGEEYDEIHHGDDSGMTGPGAPTPLSALEVGRVCLAQRLSVSQLLTRFIGRRRLDETRHSACD